MIAARAHGSRGERALWRGRRSRLSVGAIRTVSGAWPGHRPGRPAAGGNSRLRPSSARTWPQRKLLQEGPDGRSPWCSEHAPGAAGAMASAIDAVTARERRGDQGQQLVAGVRLATPRSRRACQLEVEPQRAWRGTGPRGPEARQSKAMSIRRGCSLLASNGCSPAGYDDQTLVPATAEHPTAGALRGTVDRG